MPIKLASFDIFDTSLLRLCGNPENVFYLLSKQLYVNDEDKCKSFFLWRISAECNMKNVSGNVVCIEDIYSTLPLRSFPEYTIETMIQVELEIESKMLIPYIPVLDRISYYRNLGYTIAFISDMYLHTPFLSAVLRSEGVMKDGDCIFVSCDCNFRKSDGKLFDHVRRIIKPDVWCHHGDNWKSDILMARKHGIKAFYVKTQQSKYEKRLLSLGIKNQVSQETSVLAGITRYHTLNSSSAEEFFAAQYVAPIYCTYLDFIVKKSIQHKYKKIFFLARDSYVLWEGFKSMDLHDISSSFFFVSRKSLLRPFFYSCSTADEFLGAYPNHSLVGKTIGSVLNSLGIPDSLLNKKFDYEEILVEDQQREFLDALFCTNNENIKKNSKEQFDLFVKYLRQEGVLNEEKSVMVDVGWIGTTRLMMSKIMSYLGYNAIDFIYYAVESNVLPFEYGRFSYYKQITGYVVPYIEQYFSECPYPSTLEYRMENNRVVPVFQEGQHYKVSEIMNANVCMLKSFVRMLYLFPVLSDNAMRIWAYNSEDSLINFRDNIDYTVLADVDKDKHERQIAQKWTTIEKIKFLLGVKNRGCLQEPSAIISFGYRFAKFYYPISRVLRKKRNKIEKFLSSAIKRV